MWVAVSQVVEKLLSLVGRAFRHDIKSAFSSGVLTPEGPNLLKSHLLRPQGQRESPGNNAKKRNLNLSRHRPAGMAGNSAH